MMQAHWQDRIQTYSISYERPFAMTALNRDNIPASINTLEGLMIWAMLTYTAGYGHISYAETNTT